MTYYHDYDFANLGAPYSFTPYNAYTYGNPYTSRYAYRPWNSWRVSGWGYDSP